MDHLLRPDVLLRPEVIFGIGVACVALLWLPFFLWRLFVPLKPIPLDVEAWRRFEQRRWSASAKALRHLISFGIGVALPAGTIAVPWWLGVAESPGWYVKEWWIGLFFGAVIMGVVCSYFISARAPDRCPRCRSAQLRKACASDDTWIYVCSVCEIVWRTTYSTRPSEHDHHTHHHHPW